MSQFDNTPIMSDPTGAPNPTGAVPGPAGWIQIWIKAVSQPNEQTFIDVTESPEAQPKTLTFGYSSPAHWHTLSRRLCKAFLSPSEATAIQAE
ncbi:MAG: hypothetical protein Fur002_05980 [Anaerolineales bacterium]